MIRVFSGSKSRPLANAYVSFELAVGDSDHLPFGVTDANGFVELDAPAPQDDLLLFVDAPDHQLLIFPHTKSDYRIVLPRIESSKDRLGWWHRRVGVLDPARADGRNIRIGIVDSGCYRSPSLKHVTDLGTISLTGHNLADVGIDNECHGTSVAGLIGCRPDSASEHLGLAPHAELFSVRVSFDPSPAESNQSLIADALEILLEQKLHLINCSFGFNHNHVDVQRYLDAAWEAGTLVICAAGNHRPAVCFPARSLNAISVSALGDVTQFCRDSDSYRTIPDPSLSPYLWDKPLFIPTFVPAEGKIDCIAPGVGIIVPYPPYKTFPFCSKQKSGTSYATPIVTGLLAAVLSRDTYYQSLPAAAARAAYARTVLEKMCRPLQFPDRLQGNGMPAL